MIAIHERIMNVTHPVRGNHLNKAARQRRTAEGGRNLLLVGDAQLLLTPKMNTFL